MAVQPAGTTISTEDSSAADEIAEKIVKTVMSAAHEYIASIDTAVTDQRAWYDNTGSAADLDDVNVDDQLARDIAKRVVDDAMQTTTGDSMSVTTSLDPQ